MSEISLNTKCGTEGFSSFQSIFPMTFGKFLDAFFPEVALIKKYSKNSTTGSSDGFLHLKETSFGTRWKVTLGCFSFFTTASLVELGPESLNPWRRLLCLGNASSEQNLRLKNLGYFSFISAIIYMLFGCPMPNFGYYRDYSLNNPVLITVFGLSNFDPKVSGSHTTLSAQWGLRLEPSYLI